MSYSKKVVAVKDKSNDVNDQVPRGQQLHGGQASVSVHTYTSDWENRCSHWLKDDDSLHSVLVKANPPSKNYVQIYVTQFEIIYRVIPVIPPRSSWVTVPHDEKLSYEEFELLDEDEPGNMKSTILQLLGRAELQYICSLVMGHIDYLNRLPRKVIVKIALFLDFKSIGKLSQANKHMHEICNSDAVWVKLFTMYSGQILDYDWALKIQAGGMRSAILADHALIRKMKLTQMLGKQGKFQGENASTSK